MPKVEIEAHLDVEVNAEAVREQLGLILQDPGFRTSKRSIQFLKFVVEKTLAGEADKIKERTIGVEVFGRDPLYDTNEDHVVRTAAGELRKRLTIYYANEKHRSELRMSLVPGSYVPQFKYPVALTAEMTDEDSAIELLEPQDLLRTNDAGHVIDDSVDSVIKADMPIDRQSRYRIAYLIAAALLLMFFGYQWTRPSKVQELFWKPVLETPGPVLMAVGDVPNGPPVTSVDASGQDSPIPYRSKDTVTDRPLWRCSDDGPRL
jgi:hypothetical protein